MNFYLRLSILRHILISLLTSSTPPLSDTILDAFIPHRFVPFQASRLRYEHRSQRRLMTSYFRSAEDREYFKVLYTLFVELKKLMRKMKYSLLRFRMFTGLQVFLCNVSIRLLGGTPFIHSHGLIGPVPGYAQIRGSCLRSLCGIKVMTTF